MTGTNPYEILLAEDNPGDVGLVREALKEHDVSCVLHVVHDGEHAISFLETLESNPKAPRLDLLLLDMHLPKKDGKDILKRLRSIERYARTPVIVITGAHYNLPEEKSDGRASLSYFRKPSTLEEYMQLGAIVRSLLTVAGEREARANAQPNLENSGGVE